MKQWERLTFKDEAERHEYFAKLPLPPNHSVAAFWQDPVFKTVMFQRALVPPGGSLLLISEANERCGLSRLAREAVGPAGRLAEFDTIAEGRTLHTWEIYTRICRDFPEASFDSVIATTTHHMRELESELEALMRVVRPGGGVVLADNGPGRLFFELAKQDAHLEFAADLLIYHMGLWLRFGDSPDEAYEALRQWGTKYGVEDVRAAASRWLVEVDAFEWKGLWLVNGRRSDEMGGG